jgi:hypothetical protein
VPRSKYTFQKEDHPSVRCTSDDTGDARFTIHRQAFPLCKGTPVKMGVKAPSRIDVESQPSHLLSGLRLTLMAALNNLNVQ